MKKRLFGAAVVGVVVVASGCTTTIVDYLCCTEFHPGETVDTNIGGSDQSKVEVQAVSDFAGVTTASMLDLSTACANIASDLDVASADLAKANAKGGSDKMTALCALAIAQINTAKAGLSLTLDAKPPACNVSVSAKATCQASCQAAAPACDFKANPPVCMGGSLEIECKGNCTANAGATLDCTGTCTGSCTGACTAEAGVDCAGKCDGTCSAPQPDGTCKGTCKGTCSATAPGAKCAGSCQGRCDATCKGSATASVKCDGTCDADYQPLSCTGGTLSGGCTPPDANCEGACDASARAKAQCTPPAVAITLAGSGDPNTTAKLEATLEANLGIVLALESRLAPMVEIASRFAANVEAISDIKGVCIPIVAASIATAVANLTATAEATGNVVASVR